MLYDILSSLLQLIIVYVVLIALVAYLKNIKDRKRILALKYISRWNDRIFESNRYSEQGRYKNIDSNEEFESLLTMETHLNLSFFDELALAIFNGQADEKIAREFFYLSLASTYRNAERNLPQERMNVSNGLYRNAERLYGKWMNMSKEGN